jgi:hypothetical protein
MGTMVTMYTTETRAPWKMQDTAGMIIPTVSVVYIMTTVSIVSSFVIVAFVLLAVAAVSGCATSGNQAGTGILTGKVTVGPLTPVERVDVTPAVPDPAVFTSRKLLLYEAYGKTPVEEIPIHAAGYYGVYNVTLKPGTYKLGYNYMGSIRFLPEFMIESGKTTTVDVDIDTGIR